MTDHPHKDEAGLAACPFCGGEAEHYSYCSRHHVQCRICAACEGASIVRGYDTEAEAVTAWNIRATPPVPEGSGMLEESAGLLRRLLENEADAKNNPMGGLSLGGLMDCRDNNGCVYQSADLADVISRSSAFLSRLDAERKRGEG